MADYINYQEYHEHVFGDYDYEADAISFPEYS